MADKEHLKIFLTSVNAWNKWRKANPKIRPDLSDYEFENLKRNKVILSNAVLKGAAFRQVSFRGAKFTNSHMRDCVFERSVLTNADFSHADLRGSHFYSLTLESVEFHDADLRGAQLNQGVLITNEQLSRAKTDNTTVVEGPIYDKSNNQVQVDDATHDHSADSVSAEEGLILSDEFTVLKGNEIVEILERGVDYWNDWRNKNPDIRPDLSGIDLTTFNLRGIDFSNMQLAQVNLSGVDLVRADLHEANLNKANIEKADLSSTNLSSANLSSANLRSAYLISADLRSANLRSANLSSADLSDADLSGANLELAVGLTEIQIKVTILDESTVLPGYLPLSKLKQQEELEEETEEEETEEEKELTEPTAGPAPYIASDRWTIEDELGYKLYATAISEFLKSEKTKPPLTISIQAPWGGGKSSLMKMIKGELDSDHPDFDKQKKRISKGSVLGLTIKDVLKTIQSNEKSSFPDEPKIPTEVKQKEFLTVWFNPWKYENTDQVWAGLADSIIKQLTARLSPIERERFWFQLNLNRIDGDKVRTKIMDKVINTWYGKIRDWIKGYGILAALTLLFSILNTYILAGIPVFIGGFQIIKQFLNSKSEIENEPAKISISEYIKVPNYSEKLGFIHHAEEDIKTVYDTFNQGEEDKTIVIFIDDLDRCSPTKIAAVFEGINLFLAGGFIPCFFIIGMDAEMVAAALNEAHSGVIEQLPSYASGMSVGSRYMDKFVQLPFVIPPPTKDAVNNYTESLLLTDEKIKKVVEEKLEGCNLPEEDGEIDKVVDDIIENGGNSSDHKNYARYRIKKDMDILKSKRILEKQIDSYSDDDPNIRKQIVKASKEFSNNPRELKRFINAYRYNFFIRSAINSQKKSGSDPSKYKPTLDQLREWMILSMRWPGLPRWLQHNYTMRAGSLESSISDTETRLRHLMTLCSKKKSIKNDDNKAENIKDWKKLVEETLGIKFEEAHWLHDERLINFFVKEQKLKAGERLVDACGEGFW